jgi:VIT1/CCC1 family predicted Fe2+/Mn2+ transporter
MATHPIQTEVDARYLYQQLALHEDDPVIAEVYHKMSEIEGSHVIAFAAKDHLKDEQVPGPSWRARTINFIGKIFGYDYVLGVMMDTEKSISNAMVATRKRHQQSPTGAEFNHVQILRSIAEQTPRVSGSQLARFEKRHRSVGGNAIRAAVLGGNDGLVSNFSLVMGIAGASSGGDAVILAGVAGLLAGALSMALGEWISVRSSQELYENQMQLEMEELETNPEGEKEELALIYRAKGIPADQAQAMAEDLMKNRQGAHEMLVQEELGINAAELKGSAMQAAVYSFMLFSVGAIIPLFPYFFLSGFKAMMVSVVVSALGLFLIGAAITLFTGRNLWYSGFRQALFGLLAAAVTFGIGRWIGVSIAG